MNKTVAIEQKSFVCGSGFNTSPPATHMIDMTDEGEPSSPQ